jgi:hypothetical protein
VDACTVTASDVFTAFAVSAPAFFSQSLPVFSGQSVAANRFVQRSTQPTSERRLLMEAIPFSRRHKPDIGYDPASCSCEGAEDVNHVPS